jgi:hypothetical protein
MHPPLRRVPASLAAIATVAVVVMLLTPAGYIPPPLFPGQDKVEHAGVFCVLALLWRWSRLAPAGVLAGACLVAGGTEVLQALLPIGRSGEGLDALADLGGAAAGLLAWRMVARSRNP